MTATTPRRRGPSTPVGGPLREYRLYRFHGHDGTLLYIGMTGRLPLARLVEHLMDKPWAPEIARWEVDHRVWAPPIRRDVAPGSAGRHPAVVVLSSRWTWWAVAYIAAVLGSWWLAAQVPWTLPGRWHLGVAAALPIVVTLAAWRWWIKVGRRWWRRMWQ